MGDWGGEQEATMMIIIILDFCVCDKHFFDFVTIFIVERDRERERERLQTSDFRLQIVYSCKAIAPYERGQKKANNVYAYTTYKTAHNTSVPKT